MPALCKDIKILGGPMDLRTHPRLKRLVDLAQRHRIGLLNDRLYVDGWRHGSRVCKIEDIGGPILRIIEAIIKRLRLTGPERRDVVRAIEILTSGRLKKRLLSKI
jgi:hypothetical protein